MNCWIIPLPISIYPLINEMDILLIISSLSYLFIYFEESKVKKITVNTFSLLQNKENCILHKRNTAENNKNKCLLQHPQSPCKIKNTPFPIIAKSLQLSLLLLLTPPPLLFPPRLLKSPRN